MDSYNVAKEMTSMSTDPADKEYWTTIMIKWAKEITAISVPSNVVTSCVSQPRSMPSALVTVRATASSARSTARVVSQSQPHSQSNLQRSSNILFNPNNIKDDDSSSDSDSDASSARDKIPMIAVIQKNIEAVAEVIKKTNDIESEVLTRRVDAFFNDLNKKPPVAKRAVSSKFSVSSSSSSSSSSANSAIVKATILPFHNRSVSVMTRHTNKKN